ncbi:glycosyltransferase [bacterium]|nr:glycosyltransferase [bacterium]
MNNPWVPLSSLDTPALRNNQACIKTLAPELQAIVAKAGQAESLVLQQDKGTVRCRAESPSPEWIVGERDSQEDVQDIRNLVQSIPPETRLLVLHGNAAGYVLAHMLTQFQQNPALRIVVYEPTAARVLACLALVDLSSALQTGRLHFVVGPSRLENLMQGIHQYGLLDHDPVYLLNAPEIKEAIPQETFRTQYQNASKKVKKQSAEIFSAFQQRKESVQQETIERVLLLDCWPGAPGEAHLRAIQTALESRGVQTQYHVLNRYQIEAFDEEYRRVIQPQILTLLHRFAPQMVISYGYHAPKFIKEEWYEASNAIWLQAVSNIAYHDTVYYENEKTALIEENLIPYFLKRGAGCAFFVPIMADYVTPQPARTNRRAPIVFVGNSLGLTQHAVAEFMQQWKGRDRLIQSIREAEADVSAFHPHKNLYQCMKDFGFTQLESAEEEYCIFRYLLCQGSASRRKNLLERIAHLGLHLFGGDWPGYLPKDSPLHSCFQGYLPMKDEHKAFGVGHIFVNIHSIGHVTGPNMRFFNVAGMGGFQITDGNHFQRYLEPGTEAVFYESGDEFVEKVEYYLNHIAEADTMREQGQNRVRADWTYSRWVEMVFDRVNVKAPK